MPSPTLTIAYGFFLANYLFGISVATGLVRSKRLRFLHHTLYFLVLLSLGIALLLALLHGTLLGYGLIVLFLLLLVMPRFKGRSRGHRIYATVCFLLYSLLLFL